MTSIVSHRGRRPPVAAIALALGVIAAGAAKRRNTPQITNCRGSSRSKMSTINPVEQRRAIERARQADGSDDLRSGQSLGRQKPQGRQPARRDPARQPAHRMRLRARQGGALRRGARCFEFAAKSRYPARLELSRLRDPQTRQDGRGRQLLPEGGGADPACVQLREYLCEANVIQGKLDLAKQQPRTIETPCGSTVCEEYEDLSEAIARADNL